MICYLRTQRRGLLLEANPDELGIFIKPIHFGQNYHGTRLFYTPGRII
jgi:hypothetical protein